MIQPLKESTVAHLYHFASHITGKVSLLNAKQAVENGDYFAEILLDEPLHIAVNDRLIIRSGDDRQTLGSAEVLEIIRLNATNVAKLVLLLSMNWQKQPLAMISMLVWR